MFETQNILASSKPLLNSIQLQAMQEAKALKELELKKEQQVLKDKVDELDSTNFQPLSAEVLPTYVFASVDFLK